MKLQIVALDWHSLRYAADVASHAGFELVAVVTSGWVPDQEKFPAPLLTELAALGDRRQCEVFIAGDATLLNQKRLACLLSYKAAGVRLAALVGMDADVHAGVRLRENTLLGCRARVCEGADIGANAVIGASAEIGYSTVIGHSAWIGRDCVIGDDCHIGRNCVLGDGVRIAPGCTLEPWSCLAPGNRITESSGRTLFVDPLFRAPVEIRGVKSRGGAKP